MRRLLAIAVLATLVPATSPAQEGGGYYGEIDDPPSDRVLYEDGHAGRMLLDGAWLRRLDPRDNGLAERWYDDVAVHPWEPVAVPDAWNATRLTPASQEGGIAWYRRDFPLPASQLGQTRRRRIRFESVNLRARVYLNGREVGRHTGAFLPFEVPGGRLREGEINRLVVRVDNRRTPTDMPPFELSGSGQPGGGWWNDGGILREVYLREIGDWDLRDFEAWGSSDGLVRYRGRLVNSTAAALIARPRIEVGGRTAEPQVSLPARGSQTVTGRLRIGSPRRWSMRRPFLYELRVSDGTREVWRSHVGLRRWSVRDGRLMLNGERVRLYGASLHEDEKGAGMAISPERRRRDVDALKALGANVTRAHYPLHPAMLEALDREGIALWAQIPAYRYRNHALENPGVRRRALRYAERAMARDAGHPSVAAWSVGNELNPRPGAGARRYIEAAGKAVRRKRLGVLAALDVASHRIPGGWETYRRSLDALGFNAYFGWYRGPGGETSRRANLGPYLDDAHRSYPRLALVVSEFGAEASRTGRLADKGTFAYQAELIRDTTRTISGRPWMNGAILWLLRDFRVRPGFDGGNPRPDPPFNHKGLLDYEGSRKPSFAAFRAAIRRARSSSAARRAAARR